MTDQDIERLALEWYPVNFDAYWGHDRNASERSAFIQGAKAMRERLKQDVIEAYREGYTSTESAEQYYERKYGKR